MQFDSLPILIDKLPFEEYRKIPALSFSGIKDFMDGPGYYKHWQTHEKPESTKTASDRRLYKLIHTLLGEPHMREHVVAVDGTWNEPKKKEIAQLIVAGKIVVKPDQLEAGLAVVEYLRKHEWVSSILKDGKGEQTIVWRDAESGVVCKARLDWLRMNAQLFTDWKAFDDICDEEAIERHIRRMYYQIQAGHYANGLSALLRRPVTQFANVFYRTKEPYDCKIRVLSDHDIEAAQTFLKPIYARFARCLEKDSWPMSNPEPKLMVLKPWYDWEEYNDNADSNDEA